MLMRTFKLTGLAFMASALVAPLAANAQTTGEDEPLEEIITTGSRLKANPNLAARCSRAERDRRRRRRPRQCPDRGFRQHSATGNGQPGFRDSERRHRHRGPEPARSGQEPDAGADGRTAASLRLLGISAPNLDIIPMQLVERVDILTGGASAVYGSDAVGGVANFILKRDFEGVEIGIQRGNSYSSNDNGFWRTFSRRAVSRCPAAAGTGKRRSFTQF